MNNKHPFSLGSMAVISLLLASCVYPVYGPPLPPPLPPPPVRPLLVPRPIAVLPYGVRPYYYHGERCWHHNGHYYRRNPHGHGYIIFAP